MRSSKPKSPKKQGTKRKHQPEAGKKTKGSSKSKFLGKEKTLSSDSRLEEGNSLNESAPKKRQRKPKEVLPFKEFNLRPAAYAKWNTLSKETETFIGKILETNVNSAISQSQEADIETTTQIANDLRRCLVRGIHGMKVPKPAIISHKELHSKTVMLEQQLEQNTNQIQNLEEAMEEEENLMKTLKKEKDELLKQLDQSQTPTPNKHKLHPLLHPDHLESLNYLHWRGNEKDDLPVAVSTSEDYAELKAHIADMFPSLSSSLEM